MVWNPFAISSVEEATQRLRNGLEVVKKSCFDVDQSNATWVDKALSLIGRIPKNTIDIGRGMKAPFWYRGMTHINLPDACIGYAVLDVDETGAKLQTFVR